LGVELDTSLLVVTTDDPGGFSAVAQAAGMIVIDEAHHLTRDRALYDAVRRAASRVPRLLLLSATPVLRNELGFLEMLHLLDPVVFPLDGDRFSLRIAKRRLLAEAVAGLIPANVLQFDSFIDVLLEAFRTTNCCPSMRLRCIPPPKPGFTSPPCSCSLGDCPARSTIYEIKIRTFRKIRTAVSVKNAVANHSDSTVFTPSW
jgi:hypothetical protein